MGVGGWWLSQTRPIPRSPDGDNNHRDFQAYGQIFGNYLKSEIPERSDWRQQTHRVTDTISNLCNPTAAMANITEYHKVQMKMILFFSWQDSQDRQDRHSDLTFQVNCVGQLSQFYLLSWCKIVWCQFVRCQIVWVPNCLGAKLSGVELSSVKLSYQRELDWARIWKTQTSGDLDNGGGEAS